LGKFGQKNHVKLDPLAYNICLLGESKVGKTTLIREVCEKLAGDDGYMFLECGQERGADAIEGIEYINCPEWWMDYDELTNSAGFGDVCDDIIDNKTTDYADLKVVIIDTYDQLITLAEDESKRLWNKENPDKRTNSINAAWGGFGKGEKKAIELMFDKIAELRNVGVSTIIIGHIKTKDISDPVSGETYQILTSDQQQNYFNALKKNLHFLGLAYIDRQIIKEKTGKKNIVTNKEEVVNKVKGESRKIKFRDDNFCVDSGSRFAEIIDEIDLDADQFITALTDAIKAEQAKSGKTLEQSKAEQEKEEAKRLKEIAKAEQNKRESKKLEDVISKITDFIKANKSDMDVIKPIIAKAKELGYDNPTMITDIKDAEKVLELIS
jgi:GTPase SAR1 family protein